jgi:hypothetical protein
MVIGNVREVGDATNCWLWVRQDNIWCEAGVLGDSPWYSDKAKCRTCVPKKALSPRLLGQLAGETADISPTPFDPQKGAKILSTLRSAGRNKFEFEKGLMVREKRQLKEWVLMGDR